MAVAEARALVVEARQSGRTADHAQPIGAASGARPSGGGALPASQVKLDRIDLHEAGPFERPPAGAGDGNIMANNAGAAVGAELAEKAEKTRGAAVAPATITGT